MITIDDVEMIDVKEAAERVGRTPETVRRWVWTGRIPAVKLGNKLLMSREDVAKLAGADNGKAKSEHRLSLRDWSAEVARTNTAGRPGTSASDLVIEDRGERAGDLGAGR